MLRRKLSPLARTGLVAAVCLCLAPSGFDCLTERCTAAEGLSLLDGPMLAVGPRHEVTLPGGQEGLPIGIRAGSIGGAFGDFMFRALQPRLPEIGLGYAEALSEPSLSAGEAALAHAFQAEAARAETRLPGGSGFCTASPFDPRCTRIDTLRRNASSLLRNTRDQRLPDLIPLRRDRDRRAGFTLPGGGIDPNAFQEFLDRTAADSVSEIDIGLTVDPENGQAQWMQIVNQNKTVRLVDGTLVQLAGSEGQFEKAATVARFFGPDGVPSSDDLPTSELVQLTQDVRLVGKSFAPRKDPLSGIQDPNGNLVAQVGESVQIYRSLGAGFDPNDPDDVNFCTRGNHFNVPSPLSGSGVNISGDGINASGECVLLASSREAQFVNANLLGSDSAGDNLLSRFEAYAALGDPSHRPPSAVLEPGDLTDLLLRGSTGRDLPARPPSADGRIRFPAAAASFARRVDAATGAPVRSTGPEACSVRVDGAGDPVGPDGASFGDGSVQMVSGSQTEVTAETRVNIDNQIPSEGSCLLWSLDPLDPNGARILRSAGVVAQSHAANQTQFHTLCTLGFDEDFGHCGLDELNDINTSGLWTGTLSGMAGGVAAAIAARGWQTLRLSLGPPLVQDSAAASADPNSVSALQYQLTPALTLTTPSGILPPVFLFADTQQAVPRQLNDTRGPLSNLSMTQKGLFGCGADLASACDFFDARLIGQNSHLAQQLGLDPNYGDLPHGGIDWLNAHADVFMQDFALTRASAADAAVAKRGSGSNVEPSTGFAHEAGVTTQTFSTQDLDGDGLPDNASYLRVSIAGTNVTADRLQVVGGNLTVDGTTPVDGVAALLATDFRVEPFKYERDAAAEAALGIPVFYKDPRGADGSLNTGDDPLTLDAGDEPTGENCANLGAPGTYRLTPDPGCTVAEIISVNFERLAILKDIIGVDLTHDAAETALELHAIFEGDPNQILVADPIAGPDGIVFANWITEHQTNGGGKLLGLYGFRSDEPNAPIDFGQPVAEIVASATGGGTALADIVFQLERYQKAANLSSFSFSTLFDPDSATSFAAQCVGASNGVCYRVLAGSAPDAIVGALPAGYQMFELVPAPGGPGTGDTSIQTSAITGQSIVVATPGGDFSRLELILPLQRLEPLDLAEVAGLEASPDNTDETVPLASVTYLDPDTLELREDVLIMDDRPLFGGFFCGIGTPSCFGPKQTVSLFTLDADGDYRPDLDSNRDGQLDFLDDGTPGPGTDDAVACGSGVPGDVVQDALVAELSAAELEALPSVFPRGMPVRSPSGCPYLRSLVSLTGDDGAGRRPFAWHQGAATPDADGDGVPDADDICPHARDPLQEDSGGVGPGSAADGNGDACQCGDVSNDGLVTLADFALIRSWVASGGTVPPTPEFAPQKCDVGGSAACSLADFALVRKAVAASDPALLQQVCEAATGAPN